jgi:hypothetical protein
MSYDKKQLILIVVPIIAVVAVLILTAIAIMRKFRCRSQRDLLPTTEKCPGFTEQHLGALRNWQKVKADPGHLPLIAEPTASHQPHRPAKGTWQQFKEKQHQRGMQAQTFSQPKEKWHHAPKGPEYWRQFGREMAVRRTWWEKVRDRSGL